MAGGATRGLEGPRLTMTIDGDCRLHAADGRTGMASSGRTSGELDLGGVKFGTCKSLVQGLSNPAK
jgi:hypothetical protein